VIERVGTRLCGGLEGVWRGDWFGEYSTYFSFVTEAESGGGGDIDTPRAAGFLPRTIAKRQ
jgi:hypothetical protein